jgi:hypothetical protein
MSSETNEPLDKYPWILRFVYLFGVPAAISIYLIWLMAARVEGVQREILDLLREHELNAQYNIKSNADQVDRLDRIYRLSQVMCVNSANDAMERARCFSIDKLSP